MIGYDTDSLYLYCSGDVMPCGKDTLVVNEKLFDQMRIAKFLKDLRWLILSYPTRFMTSLVK